MHQSLHRFVIYMAAALAWCSASAQAQSLRELHKTAHGYDAAYQSALAQVRASQAHSDQALAGLLPQLALQAGAQHNSQSLQVSSLGGNRSNYDVLSSSLNGSQPLYRPATRITWDQGKKQVEAAQVQLNGAEQDLIVRLSQAYFDVLTAEDALRFVRSLKVAVAKQLESAKRNFEHGNATITDSREAQARFDLALAQEISAQNDLRVKKLVLDQTVGQADSQPLALAQPIVLPVPQPDDVQVWVDRALDQHPLVVQNRMALDIARMETTKAKTGHLPTMDLQVSFGQTHYPQGNPTLSVAPGSNYHYRATAASVGVALNWPLFAGFAVESRVRETLALEDKARAELDSVQRTVSQATQTAFFDVQSGLSQVKALETAEQSSLTSLKANQISYQVGVRINIDVLNAESQLYQTRRDLSRARYDVLMGLLRLKQASGVLQADDLLPIDRLLAN